MHIADNIIRDVREMARHIVDTKGSIGGTPWVWRIEHDSYVESPTPTDKQMVILKDSYYAQQGDAYNYPIYVDLEGIPKLLNDHSRILRMAVAAKDMDAIFEYADLIGKPLKKVWMTVVRARSSMFFTRNGCLRHIKKDPGKYPNYTIVHEYVVNDEMSALWHLFEYLRG